MRIPLLLTTLFAICVLFGCDSSMKTPDKRSTTNGPTEAQKREGENDQNAPAPSPSRPQVQGRIEAYSRGGGGGGNDQQIVQDADRATISTISTVRASTQAADRKIIRNADLTIETNSPTDGLRRVTSIAESNGGFVVTSDFKHIDSAPQARPTQTVTVVARVPSSRFDAALSQIHDIDGHVIGEKISGQDVSEEYLDLEARLRTKRALEAQFLEIMRQARKVSDALEVQSELADVRTDIERLEGRRRFIENQAELSTITATLQMPQPIVVATTTGFSHSVKQSFGDAVDVASWIVLTVIQTIIVLIPVAVLIGLPGWVAFRILRRRFQSTKQAAVVPQA